MAACSVTCVTSPTVRRSVSGGLSRRETCCMHHFGDFDVSSTDDANLLDTHMSASIPSTIANSRFN